MLSRLFGWRGPSRGQSRQRCLGPCGRSLPLEKLVFINHCYHPESKHGHRSCAGVRLLCTDCHAKQGTDAYYEAAIRMEAVRYPEKYPWEDCMTGLRKYLERLRALALPDPSDRNALELAWRWRD